MRNNYLKTIQRESKSYVLYVFSTPLFRILGIKVTNLLCAKLVINLQILKSHELFGIISYIFNNLLTILISSSLFLSSL